MAPASPRAAGSCSRVPGEPPRHGFTLLELLSAITLISLLTAMGFAASTSVTHRSKTMQCAARMRALGAAIQMYANDHNGELPRSFHSAAAAGVDAWTYAVAPYLGVPVPLSPETWGAVFEKYFRCPADPNRSVTRWSYALNVHFELDPGGDDYVGSPDTWRRLGNVPRPARTVLLAEPRSLDFGDHLMCHLWNGASAALNALESRRHIRKANYLFVDGHVETLPIEAVFAPDRGIDRFNPSLAE